MDRARPFSPRRWLVTIVALAAALPLALPAAGASVIDGCGCRPQPVHAASDVDTGCADCVAAESAVSGEGGRDGQSEGPSSCCGPCAATCCHPLAVVSPMPRAALGAVAPAVVPAADRPPVALAVDALLQPPRV